MPATEAAASTCRKSRLLRFMISNGLCLGLKKPGGAGLGDGERAYWLTGDFGSSSSAITWRDLLFVQQAGMCPKRGMLEQAL